MSKASRLARPSSSSAASKLPSPRKDGPAAATTGGRVRTVSVGEKLMRAGGGGGGDGAARQKAPSAPAPPSVTQSQDRCAVAPSRAPAAAAADTSRTGPPKAGGFTQGAVHKQTKSSLKVSSPEDAVAEQQGGRRQTAPPNGTAPRSASAANDPRAPSRTVPRRHTVGGARSSREILAMQPSDMDKKREAFLEHLKQKYPHHASAIMGHQERLREQALQGMLSSLHCEIDIQRYLLKIQLPHQTRSPKHAPSPAPGVGEQAEQLSLASLESLDTMSEADAPTAFTRGSRSRASLPVVRSTNQTKDRSLGVLYLQYGDETKQIRMPNEITSGDTVRALFVGAFPQQLTMKMLESPSMAVYVKDDMRNMYYELSDVRNITDHSCLKVYHKDPAQAFSHGPRPTNGDARMHREMMYSGQHPLRQPPMAAPPHHPMQGSMSPPTPHSMPPSPSRIPFGPRQGPLPGSATVPRERLPAAAGTTAGSASTGRSASPCPSAILERRDVKPDEDLGGGKSHSLTRASEGGLYGDPYLLHEGGRMGLAAAHGPGGHPAPGDGAEHGLGGYHRASVRPAGGGGGPYGGPGPADPMEHPSLYRQKSRNSQLPTLGSKTPPPSPHRMAEVRLVDVHGGPPVERASPVRQSFRKEEAAAAKARGGVGSPTAADLQGHGGHGPAPPAGDPQTRQRMKAMEQQIASLTGLVQHALLKSPGSSGAEETPSERSAKTASPSHSAHSAGGSPILAPKSGAPPSEVATAPLHASLLQFRRNVCDLRLQLLQMRQLQLQNQEALRAQLKRAEQEIGVKLAEAVRRLDDPAQRQRVQVEEDRHKYLGLEERVLDQLGELEQYVDSLKRESGVGGGNRSVTLRDVEEGAVSLRRVGESLAGLKGEFPALQTRMRAVLRVEVEAVKFLKEEPHKLDSMLKRVKSLTEILSSLRRRATEGQLKASDPPATPVEDGPPAQTPAEAPPPPQAAVRAASPSALPPAPSSPTPSSSSSSSVRSEVVPASPVIVQRVQSSPVRMRRSQQSAALTAQPSPPATPSSASPTQGGRDSPGSAQAAAVSSSSFSSSSSSTTSSTSSEPPSPGQHKGNQPGNPEQQPAAVHSNGNGNQSLFIEELHATRSKSNSRAMSIEAAEKEWEERRQNMGHYDGKEFEKILQEAQANMMKCIPSLEVVGGEGEAGPPAPPAAPGDQADGPKPAEPATAEHPRSEPSSDKPGPEKPKPKPAPDKPAKPAAAERPPPKSAATATADRVAKPGAERASKSPPPPPPPRKTFPLAAATGMTTTRSGEVVYTGRKEPVAVAQEGEEEAPPPPPKHKPAKPLPETTPKTPTPPPDAGPAPGEEEEEEEEDDEGVKVMAELQVFQKCTSKGSKCTDVGVKGAVEPARIEPQVRVLTPLREKKSSESTREDKGLDTDENGNSTVRQSPGVIYYVTGQISKEQPTPPPPPTPPPHPGPEKATECREPPPMSPSQVSNVHPYDNFPSQQPKQQTQATPQSLTGPPVSPKPVGLNGVGFWSQKPAKRPDSAKSGSAEENSNVILNQINAEKRVESSAIRESQSASKIITPASVAEVAPPAVKAAKGVVIPPEKAASEPEEARERCEDGDEEASLSPDLPGEAPPPPHNIAFMITNTKVQALSSGEYRDLVNAKKGGVRTVTVGNRDSGAGPAPSGGGPSSPQDNGFGGKKPVIIIFDEPIDIRSAYKRLSTIFECEEELERMLAAERIDEESEESDPEWGALVKRETAGGDGGEADSAPPGVPGSSRADSDGGSPSRSSSSSEPGAGAESAADGKPDGKKKFKFKFPKKQLAALSQAIRSGAKAGKKTLQVVVYEDEEEADGTVRQHKEAKRFEIVRSKSLASADSPRAPASAKRDFSESHLRTDEIRKSTYKTLDSLEQTIKQLETTISEMGPRGPEEPAPADPEREPRAEGAGLKRSSSLPTSSSSSSSSKSPGLKASRGPLKKKIKPQVLPRPVVIPTATVTAVPTQQNASVASPTSRMPVPLSAKSRQSPGPTDKAGKQQKLQDAQRQFRQANGSAKRAGGDHKTTSPTLPASKIPAFYPSSAKGSPQSAPNSDATNPTNPSSSSSSSCSSPTAKSSIPSPHAARPGPAPSSHIPSLSNGSLKLPAPHPHAGKPLSFSSQTPNGRAPPSSPSSSSSFSSSSSSSSSPSPLSPTPLGPGAKSIRTIHTPSFTSYRPHTSSNSKSCIQTATAAKDAT